MATRFRLSAMVGCCLLVLFACGTAAQASIVSDFYPLMLAGSSPVDIVDPNTVGSQFAGVGSLYVDAGDFGGFLASAVPISRYHVLTAAHTFDRDYDGSPEMLPSGITFNLNLGSSPTPFVAAGLTMHPDFTGFRPNLINDDLAIVTLLSPLPEGVPIYELYRDPIVLGDDENPITMVGYGQTGDGVTGSIPGSASLSVKRMAKNVIDSFEPADMEADGREGPPEIFIFDFDGLNDGPDDGPDYDPTNMIGGLSLGDGIEGQLGPGDSGSPSFVFKDGKWKIAGINTVGGQFEGDHELPLFGSAGGGMLISAYSEWIDSVVIPEPSSLVVWSLLVAIVLPLSRSRKRS